jgi:hypothetical protein
MTLEQEKMPYVVAPFAPDWIASKVRDRGPGHYYRYHVEGVNESARNERDRRFSWDVPALSWRFDLTNAEVTHG